MCRIATYVWLVVLLAVFSNSCPVHAAATVKISTTYAPDLIYPEDNFDWASGDEGVPVDLYATAGYGPAPTMYRFMVWGLGGWEWVSPWIDGADWAQCRTPALRYGEYYWAAQTRSGRSIGSWQRQRGRFHIRRPAPPPDLLSPANGSVIGTRSVTFSWSSNSRYDRGSVYRLKVWKTNPAWSYDSSWTIRGTSATLSLPSGGTYHWKVAASEGWARGDFGRSWQFTCDLEPPWISIVGPPVNRWTRSASVSWSVVDADSAVDRVLLQWDGATGQLVSASGTTGVPEGKRSVTIRAQDEVGNAASAKGGAYWVDSTPPTISINVAPAEPVRRGNSMINGWIIGLSADDWNGSGIASVRSSVDGRRESVHTTTIISEVGSHTYSAKAVDNAGNSSTVSRTVVVQAQAIAAPKPPSPAPGPVTPQPVPQPRPVPTEPKPRPTPIPTPQPRVPTGPQEPMPVPTSPRVYEPVERPSEPPREDPTRKPSGNGVQPVEQKPVSNPSPATNEQPVRKTEPVQKPAPEQPGERRPTEKPAEEKPKQKPAEREPAEKPRNAPSSSATVS